ncbi:MAG: hypothetical protein OXI41_06860 [Chloroflexota bacterium]|nr:hypothetical protein [Chloroflexota bacterium]MDE2896675.1 hypothetical protein [Chloroflexota bacterium]
MPVSWQVSGGHAPYTLVIDHEAAGKGGDYGGASGVAMVGCADASGGTWFDPYVGRVYAVDPQVDSGWKTVRAVVTDANGDTAEATVDFYVILQLGSTGDILRRGETYRVRGFLMTAPDGYDVRIGGGQERECTENDPDPRCGDTVNGYGLMGVDAGIALYQEDGALHSRWPDSDRADRALGVNANPITKAVDAMIDSLGKLPRPRGD